jgi:hypothetical protein
MGTTLGKKDRETARRLRAQQKMQRRRRKRELVKKKVAFVESVVSSPPIRGLDVEQVGAVEKFKTFAP